MIGSQPAVTVVMNCLDCLAYLREAVDSVYAQTFPDWEIVLWDNASRQDIRAGLQGYDERLRYFRGAETVPLGKARNLAMAEARGEFIAFLDCDDLWHPDKLALQLRCFDAPDVGLAYTDWATFNDRGYERVRFGSEPAPQGRVFEKILFENFTCLSTLMIRARLPRELGLGFDPQFTYMEDTDLLIRVAREWEFAYVAGPLTRYRMHSASASATRTQGFRDEHERLVEKLSKLYPDFEHRYAQSIRASIAKDRAVDQWRGGNRRLARRLLRPQSLRNWKYLLTYLALFVPYPLVNWVRMRISRRATGYYY